MADRTVRAIFEARVSGAQKGMRDLSQDVDKTGKKVDGLTKDLKELDGLKAAPDIDVQIEDAQRRLSEVKLEISDLEKMEATPEVTAKIEDAKARMKEIRGEIRDLQSQKAEVRIDAAIQEAQKRISEITTELGELRMMEASPEVDVKITEAQRNLRTARAGLKELQGAKAEMKVTADVSDAEDEIAGLGDEGEEAGDAAGEGVVSGILSALGTIPIAGAVIGAGVAIAGGLILGIKQGLQIEAERDLFSARTGLDEATSARFGRAAGEAYANAWGDSVADNLETARVAMEQGLIDADAIDADVERVIASLTGISEIMQADIPASARAAGQLIKTGLVDTAEDAFDVLIAGYQNGADASQDLLDTLIEYPTHFRDLGLSAEDAVGLLVQGLDGGAFNADKVADALKELTIKVKELDATAGPALETLGLDAQAMSAAFAEGGAPARDALDQILTALAGVEDPAERARLAVGLFGTQAEDMAGALSNLNLDTAAAELSGIEGAAGAADRALGMMSDNTSTKIESAHRDIEIAMDGIKGALAEAFGDEISGAADWVARNRAPLMEFMLSVIDGTFEMGKGFLGFSATALDAIADVLDGLESMLALFPRTGELREAMRGISDDLRDGATSMREDYAGALDDMQRKANEWAAPELLKARIHDATMAMTDDMDAFTAAVEASGGTVTINGDTLTAEQALDLLVANIDGEDGTVTINGDRVPADKALATVMAAIASSEDEVTIGGNIRPAEQRLMAARRAVRKAEDDIKINGDTAAAREKLRIAREMVRSAEESIKVSADTSSASESVRRFTAGRRTIWVDVVARNGLAVATHDGGWTGRPLHSGGWVPGTDPGYDNILWPLNKGGRTLQQPLAGNEYVVNSKDAAYWAPVLEWMNAGGRPGASGGGGPVRITGTLDLGDGVMGRLVGMAEAVEQFELRAPGIALQAGI